MKENRNENVVYVSGKNLKDKVSNKKIRKMTGVGSIDKFLQEQTLQ